MARPPLFSALSVSLVVLVMGSSVLARPGRVVTPDGKKFEGDVTENKNDNTVEIVNNSDGKRYKFNAAALRGPVEYDDSIVIPQRGQPRPGQPAKQPGQPPAQGGPAMSTQEEFDKRRAALAPTDAAGRVRLARWAFERQEYDLAHEVAQEAVAIDRRSQEAAEMIRTIDAQRRLNRKAPPGQQPPAGRAPTPGATPGQNPGAAADPEMRQNPGAGNAAAAAKNTLVPPLSPDEVNRVRLLEWHGDRNVRIRLLNDVKRRFLARSDIKPADFNKLDAVDQAWEMKKNGNAELLNDIRMTNDPPAMQEYRTIVQRAVLTGCATAACHGGGAGSDKFALHPRADHEGETYANFITLHKFQYKPKKGAEASMIDRNRPEDSLLIQFGLPPEMANFPHPEVEGFRPLFRTRNDPKMKQVVKWIADSLAPIQDDYGVPFDAANERGAQPAAGGDAERPADEAPGTEGAPGDATGARPPAGQGAPPPRGVGTAPPHRPAPR